ncbi:hypothetical protein EMWEY_00001240 [Eimeria maxima]|uniref:Uncharacterized protein n=1 Tax=Eimeria maxima TaxID=5804 RepID=U6MIF5_EIMMA|nr:hypothetical protein EMWEY_00001240 [Eimeria maxima]CDJ61435.1 hypothetical protein EMWEY_00001240 [Eimeria maxima]
MPCSTRHRRKATAHGSWPPLLTAPGRCAVLYRKSAVAVEALVVIRGSALKYDSDKSLIHRTEITSP